MDDFIEQISPQQLQSEQWDEEFKEVPCKCGKKYPGRIIWNPNTGKNDYCCPEFGRDVENTKRRLD